MSSTSSGASTPHPGTQTPLNADEETLASSPASEPDALSETLRRKSFGTAALAETLPARSASDGPSKEHSEQGSVKRTVYAEYLRAASRAGFALFVGATVLQQVLGLAANVTLSYWGGRNREAGRNAGARTYLAVYGREWCGLRWGVVLMGRF